MEWMLRPLKRYAEFSGRSRRKEYWMFTLGIIIVYLVLALVMGIGFMGSDAGGGLLSGAGAVVFILFALAVFIPGLAVQVRRFHDIDKSGWFVLLNFIPYIGAIIVLVMMCLEGTKGPNRFGPDPKGPSEEVFA